MKPFQNRTAIVTGGNTGIGLATAQHFLSLGAHVVATYFRESASISGNPGIVWLRADIRVAASVEQFVGEALRRFGQIDVLVNNASLTGMAATAPFLTCAESQWRDIIDTNLTGTFLVSQQVARRMKERRSGSIIHVSSVGAYAAQELAAAYCASKAAQAALARVMSLELAPYGIRVNSVSPGDIHTAASENIVAELKDSGASGRFVRDTPVGRRGTPAEAAKAIAFLASEEASFITGTDLRVDGGFLSY